MSNNIKKFGEFVKEKKFRKVLSRLVVDGEIKPLFFIGKKRNFEIHIFYTSQKGTIIDVEIEGGLSLKELKLDIKVGDDISKVYEWVEKNGHNILYNFER